jgi:hypothetical protein
MLRRTRFIAMIVALILMTGLISASVQAAVTADSVISIAQSLRGKVKYAHAYDTTNLKFDCSGFVLYVFRKAGLDLRTNDDDYQVKLGVPVSKANLKKGDLVFFNSNKSNPNDVTHVGIYMGNGYVIHNTSSAGGVIVTNMNTSSYMKNDYKTARRVIGVPLINVPKDGKAYVVTDHGWVTVRSKPSTSSAALGRALFPRPYQLIKKYNNYWYQIRYNGKIGYITTDPKYVHAYYPNSSSSSTTGRILMTDHGWVNVRKGPSLSAKIIGRLYYGQKYELVGKYNDYYYKVRYNGQIGYVTTSPLYVHVY